VNNTILYAFKLIFKLTIERKQPHGLSIQFVTFTHPVIKKWFQQVKKKIIATSSAELFSAVLYCALACTGVL
jgi:hypothetical protein